MTTDRRWRRRAAILIASVVVLAGVAVLVLRDYAADPTGPKDCPPLATTSATPSVAADELRKAGLPWAQVGGSINDVSCLDRTPVSGIVEVTDEDTVRRALAVARERGLKVTPAGARHSMGGQAFAPASIVLDMRGFNQVTLDLDRRMVTAQSGATWHQIQNLLHPRFAVKAMQSTDVFTVGGSISVNAHGMDHRAGSVGRTVRSMRVMLADGTIHRISRDQEPELFSLVVGGYGLFGVILDAELEITENRVYQSARRIVDYSEFGRVFAEEVLTDDRYALLYGHLSTAPQSFLRETLLYTYREVDAADADIPPLGGVSAVRLRRLVFNLSKTGGVAMRLKWWAEKYVEPMLESCTVQVPAAGDGCFVSRNEPMHDSVEYLGNRLADDTDILHEYFVPRDRLAAFVDGLRAIALEHNANLLNASIRVAHREDNFLNYTPVDTFAVVLYLNQRTGAAANQRMAALTSALIDLSASLGGRFFLPYQLHYTAAQLQQSYPEIGAFFAAKRRYDPDELFTNTFYQKYGS